MSYLVLARKWRPRSFDDLVGQEAIARILKNSMAQGRIAHAYIFSGPRGVGKTSTARILARALNCQQTQGPNPAAEPCGECESCRSVLTGASMDVIEIDGASNNSVNDIRELREMVKYAPSGSKYKVYIIDESHMLSESAFNALLKTLEEPPAHVIFVMATTEPRKIPLTVLSRCQHLPFRRISARTIRGRLETICASEGIKVSGESLGIIARAADGSMRDSLTFLDQVASASTEIDDGLVKELLGMTDRQPVMELCRAVLSGNRDGILEGTAALAESGADFRQVLKDLIAIARDLLCVSVSTSAGKAPSSSGAVTDLAGEDVKELEDLMAASSGEEHLLVLLSELVKAEPEVRFSSSPRIAFEMALLKASYFRALVPVKEALRRLENAAPGEIASLPETTTPPKERQAGPAPRRAESLPEGDAPAAAPKRNGLSAPKPELKAAPEPAPAPDEQSGPPAAAVEKMAEKAVEKTRDPVIIIGMLRQNAPKPMIYAALSEASGKIEDGFLVLDLIGINPLFEDALKENDNWLESEASALYGGPLKIKVNVKHKKVVSRRELFEQAGADPYIKKALELFDGKIAEAKEKLL